MKLPPLLALRAFEAVARHRSVRKAADELAVHHTVVSRHVHALQAALDVVLVQTSRQGVTLTQAGIDYAATLTPAFSAIAGATARLETGKRSRNLAIWSIPGFALRWLTPRLPQFRKLWPAIDIELRPTDSPPDLSTFEADAEIRYGDCRSNGVHTMVLARPRVFPVVSPAWLAEHPKVKTPADLLGQKLIHEESYEQWGRWLAQAGVSAPDSLSGPKLWHAHLAIEAAKLGQGVAIANELIVGNEIAAGDLVEIGTTNIVLEPYVLIARNDRWNEPALTKFRSWLIDQLRV
jgi:LysR family glycine cleavage system transcriptional activator